MAKIGADERLVIVIAIGYGDNEGRPHKSKDIFEFSLNENDEVKIAYKSNIFGGVDKGIVKYHFEVGADRKI